MQPVKRVLHLLCVSTTYAIVASAAAANPLLACIWLWCCWAQWKLKCIVKPALLSSMHHLPVSKQSPVDFTFANICFVVPFLYITCMSRLDTCPTSPSLLALQIADRGVRALVKVLDSDNVVTFLNLQDNQVSRAMDTIQALAREPPEIWPRAWYGALAAEFCTAIWVADFLLAAYRCTWKVDRRLPEP